MSSSSTHSPTHEEKHTATLDEPSFMRREGECCEDKTVGIVVGTVSVLGLLAIIALLIYFTVVMNG